jgi:hypothetical protein
MKATLFFLFTAATAVLAAPTPQKPTMAGSLQDMIAGAVNYPSAFLSGNPKAVADATAKMTGGAASFSDGFFNDLQKGAGKGA